MPNLKIYIDADLCHSHATALTAALQPIRDCIMRQLNVPAAACQLAILPVIGLPDQPQINVELQILPHPDRTRPRIEALGRDIAALLATITGTTTGTGPAFRCMQHDPSSYITLK